MAEDYPVNVVFDAVDRVTRPMRRINSRIERMTGPLRRLNNRFRALARESGVARLRDSLGRVGSATGRVVRQFGALATKIGLVGGLAGTALVRVVSGVASTGDELAKFARSIGMSAEFLQEYQFVAERVGVSQEVMKQSFVAFDKRLGEMKSGYGRLNTLLRETNPELQEQLKATENSEEAFGLLMSAMEKMEDPSKRTALAAAAFSRQGVRMTNIAQAGSEEVERLRRRAHELGLILDEDALRASERYQDSLTNMKSAFEGLRNIIGAAMMPVFADLMDRMTIFFVNNRDQIREWAENFATRIPGALADLHQGAVDLLDRLQPLISVIQWMFDTFGTAETILGAVAVVMGGPLLAAVVALGVQIASLVAVIVTTPLGWLLAGVAAIAAAVWGASKAVDYVRDNWPGIWQSVSDKIGLVIDTFAGLWDLLTGNFKRLQERVSRMTNAVSRLVPDWLKDWLSSADDGPEVAVRGDPHSGAAQAAVENAAPELLERRQLLRRRNQLAVDIDGVPPGVRVEREGDDDDRVSVTASHALVQ